MYSFQTITSKGMGEIKDPCCILESKFFSPCKIVQSIVESYLSAPPNMTNSPHLHLTQQWFLGGPVSSEHQLLWGYFFEMNSLFISFFILIFSVLILHTLVLSIHGPYIFVTLSPRSEALQSFLSFMDQCTDVLGVC